MALAAGVPFWYDCAVAGEEVFLFRVVLCGGISIPGREGHVMRYFRSSTLALALASAGGVLLTFAVGALSESRRERGFLAGRGRGSGLNRLALVLSMVPSVMVLGGARAPGGPLFLGARYAAGDYPHSVAIGDLDGDGDADLGVANGSDDNVSVLLNQGREDCNGNGNPDECDTDCGPPAGSSDLPGCGQSEDCAANVIPEECDIRDGTSPDCFGFDAGNETLPAVDSLLDALAEVDAEPLISFSYSDLAGYFTVDPAGQSGLFTAHDDNVSTGEVTRVAGVGPWHTAVFTGFPGAAAFALALPIRVPCQGVAQTSGGSLTLVDIDGDSFVAGVIGEWERLTSDARFTGQLSFLHVNMNANGVFEGADGVGFSMSGFPPVEEMAGMVVVMYVPGWFFDESGDLAGFANANVGVIGAVVRSNTSALRLFPLDTDKHSLSSGRLDTFAILDCNGNGVPDECDIRDGTSPDCNANGVPDECEFSDCNQNCVPDGTDIGNRTSRDCTGNGVPDECEPDCNGNSIPDSCDIADGTSEDCNANWVPDECEPDCNENDLTDSCDIDLGHSADCNANGVPDECDIADGASDDCQPNGIPDDCEWLAYQAQARSRRNVGRRDYSLCQLPDQLRHGGVFAAPLDADLGEVAADSFTLTESVRIDTLRWWGTYRDRCNAPCEVADDFEVTFYLNEFGFANTVVGVYSLGDAAQQSLTGQSIPFEGGFDEYEYSAELVPPLSAEAGRRYWVEIRNNVGTPCVWWWETAPQGATCNSSSLYDAAGDGFDVDDLTPYDLAFCVSGLPAALDCNANDVDDAQDILDGTSLDCQPNGVPDECEDDRNYNGVADTCDIVSGTARDVNFNGVPDEGDCMTRPADLDGDCDLDLDDFALFFPCLGLNGPNLLGGCVCADLDGNAMVDMDDYLAFSMQAAAVDETCRVTLPDACPDSWVTAGPGARGRAGLGATETFYNFGLHGPIPAGFFGEGSDPFAGVVAMVGRPVDPNGVYGDIDTQIQHGPVVFDPETGTAQATLDLSTLDLISPNPITVTYSNGKDPEEWLVVAGLSRTDPGSGQLEATLDEPGANAGMFDATVYVQPAFLFVKLQDLVDDLLPECVTIRLLDTGPQPPTRTAGRAEANGEAAGVIDPITLSFTGEPFVRVASPSVVEQLSIPACAQGNFVPGVVEPPGAGRAAQELTCTSHITKGEAHYFCPPECEGDDVYLYTELRDGSTPLPGSGPPPPFPRQTLGPIPPGGPRSSSDYTARFAHSSGGGGAVKLYGNPTPVPRQSTCEGGCCTDTGDCVMSTQGLCQGCYLGDDTQCAPNSCSAIVVALGGRRQDPDPTNPDLGTFHIAGVLDVLGYDVRMYNENAVIIGGAGTAYNEVKAAIQNDGVTRVAIFGYSWGGGSTHDLASELDDKRATIGTFCISFTAYIDAIAQLGFWSETRRPPSTAFHLNYYQQNAAHSDGLVGGAVQGAMNINVTDPNGDHNVGDGWVDDNGELLTHYTIDDDGRVEDGIIRELRAHLGQR